MDSHSLSSFVDVLIESVKILTRNGQLIAIIASLYLIFFTLLSSLTIFSSKQILQKLFLQLLILSSTTSFDDPQFTNLLVAFKKDVGILLALELFSLLGFFSATLFTTTATTLLSAMSHIGKKLSAMDLLLLLAKSWKRPLITSFHITLFTIGYIVFSTFIIPIPPFLIEDHDFASKAFTILLSLIFIAFYIYFSVSSTMAMVISVTEQSCYGKQALGKAGGLVKGKVVHGFVLNMLNNLLLFIGFQIVRMVKVKNSKTSQIFAGMFLICCICLLTMFQYVTYTVLYFRCKINHGEEIELLVGTEYQKVPALLFDFEDISKEDDQV